MKKFKELHACLALLRAVLARNDISPDQRKHVEAAIEQVKILRRKTDAKRNEVFHCVRQIAEELINAFVNMMHKRD